MNTKALLLQIDDTAQQMGSVHKRMKFSVGLSWISRS